VSGIAGMKSFPASGFGRKPPWFRFSPRPFHGPRHISYRVGPGPLRFDEPLFSSVFGPRCAGSLMPRLGPAWFRASPDTLSASAGPLTLAMVVWPVLVSGFAPVGKALVAPHLPPPVLSSIPLTGLGGRFSRFLPRLL